VVKHSEALINIDDRVGTMMKYGTPDTKEGYKVDPDREYSISEDDINRLKGDAHDSFMTQDQFYKQLHTIDERVKSQGDNAKTSLDADRNTVFEEWGASKAANLEDVQAYIDLMGFDVSTDRLDAGQLRAFAKAANSTKGESIQAAKDKSSGADLMAPAEAEQAINAIMNGDAYFDATNPGHKHARHRVMQLNDMAAGRKPSNEYSTPILQVQR